MAHPPFGHHLEICMSVPDMQQTVDYYLSLGFEIYSGGVDKGWCTVTDGLIHLAFFPQGFIEKEFGVKVLLNYRGGNIAKIIKYLEERKVKLDKKKLNTDGTGDALLTDLNGVKLYFDTVDYEERVHTDEIIIPKSINTPETIDIPRDLGVPESVEIPSDLPVPKDLNTPETLKVAKNALYQEDLEMH